MKNFEKITSIIISIIVLSFSIVFFRVDKKEFSESENRYLEKFPKILSHIYVLTVVIISFLIFNGEGIVKIMRSGNIPFISQETIYYLKSYSITIIIGIIYGLI